MFIEITILYLFTIARTFSLGLGLGLILSLTKLTSLFLGLGWTGVAGVLGLGLDLITIAKTIATWALGIRTFSKILVSVRSSCHSCRRHQYCQDSYQRQYNACPL
jgi:hypothetical protein